MGGLDKIASGDSQKKEQVAKQKEGKLQDDGYSNTPLDAKTRRRNLGIESGGDDKNLFADIPQLQKQIKDLEGHITFKQEKIKKKQREIEDLNSFFAENISLDEKSASIANFQKEISAVQQEISKLEKSKESLSTTIQRLEEEKKDSSKKCDDIQTAINPLKNKIKKQEAADIKAKKELGIINAKKARLGEAAP